MKLASIKSAATFLNSQVTGFASMDAITLQRITGGKSNPFVNAIHKVQTMSVRISTSPNTYGNSVNNQSGREGIDKIFVTGPLPKNREWTAGYEGLILEGTPKGGEFTNYLRVYINKVQSTSYVYQGDNDIVTDSGTVIKKGDTIEKSDIIGFPKSKPSSGNGQNGNVKEVYCRDYKIGEDSELGIKELRYAQKVFA